MVELYPLRLKVKLEMGLNARTVDLSISKASTVRSKAMLRLDEDESQVLWFSAEELQIESLDT